MSRPRTCHCGEPAAGGWHECGACREKAEHRIHEEFNNRSNVQQLNACEDLDELKDWIKQHILGEPS